MKSTRNNPIGIFDSGLGGLTVARSVRKHLPEEDIVYFGDTARVPYGNKSAPTIIRFSREIMEFMLKKNVKMVIAACNTASSLGLQALKKHYSVPVMGVIEPGVKEAARISKNGKVGVIGTSSTVNSGAYDRQLKKVAPRLKLFSKACPLFVPLVENGHIHDPITIEMAKRYLSYFNDVEIDTLILGCTHYPILENVISSVIEKVKLVDSSSCVAKEAKSLLDKKGIAREHAAGRGALECFVSDDAEGFSKSAAIFLGEKVRSKKVAL